MKRTASASGSGEPRSKKIFGTLVPVALWMLLSLVSVATAEPFCSMCTVEGQVITEDTLVLTPEDMDNALGSDVSVTCRFFEDWGMLGGYNVTTCEQMQNSNAPELCGCQAPVVDPEPTAAPVDPEPTAAPVGAPVVTPIVVLTASPAPAAAAPAPTGAPVVDASPTGAPATEETSMFSELVFVRMGPVDAGNLTNGFSEAMVMEALEEACTKVYEGTPVLMDVYNITSVSCRVVSLEVVTPEGRRSLRALQAEAVLDTLFEVTVEVPDDFDPDVLGPTLLTTMQGSLDAFYGALLSSGSEFSQAFFATVEFADAYDPDSIPPVSADGGTPVSAPPTGSPTDGSPAAAPTPETTTDGGDDDDDSDDGLSTGAKIGITVAVLVVFFGGIAFYLTNSKKKNTEQAERSAANPPDPPEAIVAEEAASKPTKNMSDDDVSDTMVEEDDTLSVVNGLYETHTIISPPGKVGIVLDYYTNSGPVVVKVNPGSVLEGKVCIGDTIVAVNGQKTRNMPTDKFRQILAETENEERKFRIKRETDDSVYM